MPKKEAVTDASVEAWKAITEAVQRQQEQASGLFKQLGLNPGHVRALQVLQLGTPRRMRWLADQFVVDASTVTWIVDRLEEEGLVLRRPMLGDRRVRVVELTRRGARIQGQVLALLYEPPSQLLTLPNETLVALRDAFAVHDDHEDSNPADEEHSKTS